MDVLPQSKRRHTGGRQCSSSGHSARVYVTVHYAARCAPFRASRKPKLHWSLGPDAGRRSFNACGLATRSSACRLELCCQESWVVASVVGGPFKVDRSGRAATLGHGLLTSGWCLGKRLQSNDSPRCYSRPLQSVAGRPTPGYPSRPSRPAQSEGRTIGVGANRGPLPLGPSWGGRRPNSRQRSRPSFGGACTGGAQRHPRELHAHAGWQIAGGAVGLGPRAFTSCRPVQPGGGVSALADRPRRTRRQAGPEELGIS